MTGVSAAKVPTSGLGARTTSNHASGPAVTTALDVSALALALGPELTRAVAGSGVADPYSVSWAPSKAPCDDVMAAMTSLRSTWTTTRSPAGTNGVSAANVAVPSWPRITDGPGLAVGAGWIDDTSEGSSTWPVR